MNGGQLRAVIVLRMHILRFDVERDSYDFLLDWVDAATHRHPLREHVRAVVGRFDAVMDGRRLVGLTELTIPANLSHRLSCPHGTRLRVTMTGLSTSGWDARVVEAVTDMRIGAASLKPFTTQELAARAYLSPSRFAALFREQVGMSAGRYLAFERLKSIVRMHLDTGATLTVAAHAHGLYDAAHLNRLFRSHFGVAPSLAYNSQTVQAGLRGGT